MRCQAHSLLARQRQAGTRRSAYRPEWKRCNPTSLRWSVQYSLRHPLEQDSRSSLVRNGSQAAIIAIVDRNVRLRPICGHSAYHPTCRLLTRGAHCSHGQAIRHTSSRRRIGQAQQRGVAFRARAFARPIKHRAFSQNREAVAQAHSLASGCYSSSGLKVRFPPNSGHLSEADKNCDYWCGGFRGAGDEIRTHDPNLGKVVLYP